MPSTDAVAESAAPKVIGYERLHAQGDGMNKEAGELLLSELSCLACHGDGPREPAKPLGWKAGPDLSSAGERLRAEWVRAFLHDPAATRPGTTMPNLMAGRPEVERAELVENLTHYLMQQCEPVTARESFVGVAKQGKELFNSVGCVACHTDLPLEGLGEKYAAGQLARFLEKPLQVRPSGRMPDLRLPAKDAANLAAFLSGPAEPQAVIAAFTVDPAKAGRGAEAYQSLGCVSCHDSSKAQIALVPLPPGESRMKAGCLAPEPTKGVAHYRLSEDQREAIRSALTARAVAKPEAEEQALPAEVRQVMLQRNCFACHVRDGLGGPKADVAVHFTSTKDDLGDLGRLPPPLDGVGRKFQRPALEAIIHGRDPVRKYMGVRMPDFGTEFARELSKLLEKADAGSKNAPVVAHGSAQVAGRNDWGRELIGIKGYACIACHELQGHASLGIGAYDLAHMPRRLRPEWIRDFLLNPALYPTGSRMPPFWPAGKPMNPNIGGGTADSQISSILTYLMESDESLPPEGIADRTANELKPTDRPIIFRTFLAGAGTHAIAVGFPGGVNVAFDSLTSRWALAWRGRFLDADSTWNQRYSKMEKPLGEALIRLGEAGTLSVRGKKDLLPQYRGYRIGEDGVPVFDYTLGSLAVEDRVEPLPNQGLRRTLKISGQTTEGVQFTAKPPTGVQVKLSNDAGLSFRMKFNKGVAELVEEITW
ncbi:hypothetical protein [Prosthecobacter fusiformis]|nr:hypothetical protein [Prosthecobacter fusiformis]